MLKRRYTIIVADRSTGGLRRFTIGLRPTLAVLVGAVTVASLGVVLVRWNTQTEMAYLRGTNASLHLENASYRAATGELTSQITSLQAAIADLSERATLKPESVEAINQLPSIVKTRAMGGGDAAASAEALALTAESAETTLDVLRDLLQALEDRLSYVRSGVVRREILADATPSIWPTRGWLSATYGRRRDPFTGQRSFHPALDVSADAGTPIVATATGTVKLAAWSGAYGNLVTLEHGFGIRTRYGHMSRFAVEPGQTVKRGDVIGYVGSTGRTTGAHVHYELWVNDKPMNPLRLLARPE